MNDELTIHIYSFSYHTTGIPRDTTGHGEGFVFDCRFLPNPGREERYVRLDGRDAPVREYLLSRPEVDLFWSHVRSIADGAAAAFRKRGFTDMTISFGCTGGQHRSVFFAERLHDHLTEAGYHCRLNHTVVGGRGR